MPNSASRSSNPSWPKLTKPRSTKTPKPTANPDLPSALIVGLRQALLEWYGASGRDLPWRRSRDAYAIWISEIMLQQTQVQTVLPYYDRWLQQFPDIASLAAADLQTVLKAWEGLGYYARARNLHRAAQTIVAEFNGQFPADVDAALSLPGIGRTTAGGILSASFDFPLPIMDGNVKRVLARFIGLEVPPAKALDRLWTIAAQLVPPNAGRDFNQAFMDLGATVCTPHNPACGDCPWQLACAALRQGRQAELPITERKGPLPHKTIAVVAVWNSLGEILINQRPEAGLLGGLWEFPAVEVAKGRSIPAAIAASIPASFGVQFTLHDPIVQIEHTYTHFKATFHLYRAELVSETFGVTVPKQWVSVDRLEAFPFPKSHLKMIAAFRSTRI
jgi:A/G-specific adenine glycosylase